MGKYKGDLAIGVLANVVGILNFALGYRFLANYYGWNVGASVPPAPSGSAAVHPGWPLVGACHNDSRRNRPRYRMGKDVYSDPTN